MATSFDEIIDLGLIVVQDYKLNKLYLMDEQEFNTYCDGFLVASVPDFEDCRQSLVYDETQRSFESDLTPLEISILADFWAIRWFKREVMNSSQFNAALLVSQSFRRASEAQNLKEKSSFLFSLEEDVNRKLTRYELADVSTADW